MTTLFALKVVLEIIAIAALIIGFAYEDKIAKWERAFIGAILWTIEEHKENKTHG